MREGPTVAVWFNRSSLIRPTQSDSTARRSLIRPTQSDSTDAVWFDRRSLIQPSQSDSTATVRFNRSSLIQPQQFDSTATVWVIDVKNLQKGIKNLKKPGFNPKNKKP